MEIKIAVDKSGNEMPYKLYDGTRYAMSVPGDVKEHLQNIGNMDYQKDDTLILSYPKSGTHWCYEIVNMIRTGKPEYHERMARTLDYSSLESIENTPSPRVFASHLFTRHLPKNFLSNKRKIVHIYRNPKDVSVSFYNFIKRLSIEPYDGKWEDFFGIWMQGVCNNTWFEYVKDVTEFIAKNPDYPILTVSYENMKKDLETEVKRIAAFLEQHVDNDLCKAIADKCQFAPMNKAKNDRVPEEVKSITNTGTHIFYRKGEVGDWKNWYTVAMNEVFDQMYEKEMADFDLDVKFTI